MLKTGKDPKANTRRWRWVAILKSFRKVKYVSMKLLLDGHTVTLDPQCKCPTNWAKSIHLTDLFPIKRLQFCLQIAMPLSLWSFLCTWILDRNTHYSYFFNTTSCWQIICKLQMWIFCISLFSYTSLHQNTFKSSVFLAWSILNITYCFTSEIKPGQSQLLYMKYYIQAWPILLRYSLFRRKGFFSL